MEPNQNGRTSTTITEAMLRVLRLMRLDSQMRPWILIGDAGHPGPPILSMATSSDQDKAIPCTNDNALRDALDAIASEIEIRLRTEIVRRQDDLSSALALATPSENGR